MRPKFRDTSVPTFLTVKVRESLLNATQEAEAQRTEESLSSAVALLVVLILLFCLVSVSLATYCFHKWKLRSKRLQKAHEEYQKDYENSGHRITSRLV
ncbi:hypothetical protein NXF25_016163 [Crotalus adamanteus]|uniref:Uncharacterized protein n=1 Tax=Crotalus adamanteus TaxID=8729 RepID=A0AAW1AW29_CROAD